MLMRMAGNGPRREGLGLKCGVFFAEVDGDEARMEGQGAKENEDGGKGVADEYEDGVERQAMDDEETRTRTAW